MCHSHVHTRSTTLTTITIIPTLDSTMMYVMEATAYQIIIVKAATVAEALAVQALIGFLLWWAA